MYKKWMFNEVASQNAQCKQIIIEQKEASNKQEYKMNRNTIQNTPKPSVKPTPVALCRPGLCRFKNGV